jgi:hypothetical protein
MPVLGKLALAVVAGGVALGTMLGAAANPVMKHAPEEPWRGMLQAPVAADIEAQRVATAAEAAASPQVDIEPVAPADVVALAPSTGPASYQRTASHLDDLY